MNAVLAYVEQSDFRVSGRLREWSAPRWFRVWMLAATRLGDGWIWLATAVVLVGGGPALRHVLGAGLFAAVLTNASLVVLKRSFRRRRPCDHAPLALGAGETPCYFPSDRFSFPSGHSMNAFAIGVVLSLAFPSAAPLLLLLAGSIATSRVVLGYHFVSDVLVGSALGAVLGLFAFQTVVGL